MLARRTKADPDARRKLTAALKGRKFRPIGTRSRLYEAFESEDLRFVYFVGRDGELRMSRSARLSDSISIRGLDAYSMLLDEGRTILEDV